MMNNQKEIMLKQRELQMATMMAQTRDFVWWIGSFIATYGTVAGIAARRTGSPAILVPILPLSFVFAFNYDLAYGNKMERVKLEAERILENEKEWFMVPRGNLLVSPEEYARIFTIARKNDVKQE